MNDNSIHSISDKNCGYYQDHMSGRDKIASLFLVVMIVISLAGCSVPSTDSAILPTPSQVTGPLPEGWIEKVSNIVWVAYSHPSSDSKPGLEATPDEILADLDVLRNAGFNGLVTYASTG